jgi:flagellar M-ring protein FliF
METTLAPAALAEDARNARPVPALSLNRLNDLPARNKVVLGVAAALLAGVMGVSMLMGREPEWRVLYANMNDRDGGAVLTALTQLNVPYKFTEGSGTLMVPAQRVHDVRLRLASQGLPKGGTVGFELMENQKFGVTQFQERLNFQRGLEGELARSIMALSAVQSARVHLALPAQTAFMREQQKPSASVMLTLYGGRELERGQIAGIVHLVASSVPEMATRAVSVVDQNGTLLSQAPGEVPNGLDAPQLQYVRQTEQSLATRILSILEPIVGAGNVRAQVTADIDFTQSESTAEVYTPNQGSAPAAVRSQQLSETPGASAAQAAAQQGGVARRAGQPAACNAHLACERRARRADGRWRSRWCGRRRQARRRDQLRSGQDRARGAQRHRQHPPAERGRHRQPRHQGRCRRQAGDHGHTARADGTDQRPGARGHGLQQGAR